MVGITFGSVQNVPKVFSFKVHSVIANKKIETILKNVINSLFSKSFTNI